MKGNTIMTGKATGESEQHIIDECVAECAWRVMKAIYELTYDDDRRLLLKKVEAMTDKIVWRGGGERGGVRRGSWRPGEVRRFGQTWESQTKPRAR